MCFCVVQLILLKTKVLYNNFIFCIAVTILFLTEIVLRMVIKKNEKKLELKKKAKVILWAKIRKYKAIPGRPTFYILDVEYEENQKIQKKCVITHGRFARKYEHEKNVRIVLVPEIDRVFLEEESWKEINMVLRILFVGLAILLVLMTGVFFCSGL